MQPLDLRLENRLLASGSKLKLGGAVAGSAWDVDAAWELRAVVCGAPGLPSSFLDFFLLFLPGFDTDVGGAICAA